LLTEALPQMKYGAIVILKVVDYMNNTRVEVVNYLSLCFYWW